MALAGTPSSPTLLGREDLGGVSMRRQAWEELRAEGERLIAQERAARRSRRFARKQRHRDQLASTALMLRSDHWEETEEHGIFLAQNEQGSWMGPSWKDRTWFTTFNPLKPRHLAAWMATARTGKIIFVEHP